MSKICNLIYVFIVIGLIACKGQSVNETSEITDEQEAVIAKHIGNDDILYFPNSSKQLMLCLQNPKYNVANPRQTRRYLVLELSSNNVLHKGSIESGEIKWYDENRLEIFNEPGTMPKEMSKDDFTVIYDVKTKEQIEKKDLQ